MDKRTHMGVRKFKFKRKIVKLKPKTLDFWWNCMKVNQHDAWRRQKWENGGPRWAKVSHRAPKVCPLEPKGSQREPKGSQREPKVSQRKRAQGRPKCIQKSTFGKGREKDEKRACRLYPRPSILGAIFHQKSMKKSMLEKVMKFDENRCENGPIFWYFSRKMFM